MSMYTVHVSQHCAACRAISAYHFELLCANYCTQVYGRVDGHCESGGLTTHTRDLSSAVRRVRDDGPVGCAVGDGIPKPRAAQARQLAAEAECLLVVGSSLMVYSAFRLAKAAKDAGAAVVLLSVGPNRADSLADCKARCPRSRAPSGAPHLTSHTSAHL